MAEASIRTQNRTIRLQYGQAAKAIAVYDIRNQANIVAGRLTGDLVEVFGAYIAGLKAAVRNRPTRLAALWQQAGEEGQRAILASYDAAYGNSTPYRWDDQGKNRRYSNRALRRALASPQLFRAGPDGLDFIRTAYLDQEARQWYRLNFGAAPRGLSHPSAQRMSFFGLFDLKGLNLDAYGPSGGFSIPPGVWSNQALASTPKGSDLAALIRSGTGRGRAFYPVKLDDAGTGVRRHHVSEARLTRGIQGTGFLNDGVDAVNKAFPQAFEKLFVEWGQEALGNSTGSRPPGSGYLGGVAGTPRGRQLMNSLNTWYRRSLRDNERAARNARLDIGRSFPR
jgi:hypothetical protein